jgi:23S rRNA pseudouridine955/2504/2580 synthase
MYGKGRINNMARDLYGLQRMFLHSYRLVFVHPFTKQQISLVDPLPTDLTDFLKKLPEFKVETLNLL